MEPPNLDFLDFGIDFILMFMVFEMQLVGKFISYISLAVVAYSR